jgi:16S rRNA (cytosine967-C5)-methyltransferase
MISPARRLCYRLLTQIESRRLFSDAALNSESMERLEVRDRHLTTEIAYGTLRWQAMLDYILAAASSRPLQKLEPGARILLRMSVYQMWQMDRIPDHALVNDAVELAKLELGKGIDRYVNGVLRNLGRTRPWRDLQFLSEAPPCVRVSLPQWLWERWSARFGEKTATEYALSLTKHPQQAFRCDEADPDTYSSNVIHSDLVPGVGIRISGNSEEDRGFHQYQDEASQLIPNLLGSLSGMKIWDSCAAPGGKTAILSRLCGDGGHVVSSDVNKERAFRMAEFLRCRKRSKLDVLVADASRPAPFRCRFDVVLADVPCSGLGTLRRNPEIKWNFRPEDFESLRHVQKEILDSTSASVRVGGFLLYSTCSTEPEENESVVESFLKTHSEFTLERPSSPVGVENWTGGDSMVRTFPSTRLWDGFFAVLLLRRG